MSEFQKDLKDVFAGIGHFLKSDIQYKNFFPEFDIKVGEGIFFRNLTSKLARSTLTSPGTIRVKGPVV
jgi:hypothetical protein